MTIEIVRRKSAFAEDCEERQKSFGHLSSGCGNWNKVLCRCVCKLGRDYSEPLGGSFANGCMRRFVNVSSFAVYTNEKKPRSGILDENCPTETQPVLRGDSYCFAKTKQDELVIEYGKKHGLPYVLVRPGVVYGPGKRRIHGRIGIDTFGVFRPSRRLQSNSLNVCRELRRRNCTGRN